MAARAEPGCDSASLIRCSEAAVYFSSAARNNECLSLKRLIERAARDAGAVGKILDRGAVIAARAEHLDGVGHRRVDVEFARPTGAGTLARCGRLSVFHGAYLEPIGY